MVNQLKLSKIIQLGGFLPLSIKDSLLNPFGIVLKIREKFRGSGILLTNNEIKDAKVIDEFHWKELPEKLLVKKEDVSIFLDHYWQLIYH